MNYKIVKWPESQNFMDREDCFEVPDLQAYIVPENVYNDFFKKIEEVIWDNDLIRCPSQCYAYFTSEDKSYCIYLRWRWRWDDPWTTELVPITPSGEFDYLDEWLTLDVNDYSHDDFIELQKECIEIVKRSFKDIKWNTQYRV